MIQAFKMSLKSISGNKLRAFLTMLGIIIGVMALVILVSLVSGATGSVTDTINSLGTNMVSVSIYDDKGAPLTLQELDQWAENPAIAHSAPYIQESVTGKYGAAYDSVTVYGTTAAYYDIQGLNILLGRYIKSCDVENCSNVCIINETLATELIGYTDCLGEELSLNGVKYTVVGVLEDDDDSLTAAFGSGSLTAYVPYTSLVKLSTGLPMDVTAFYVSAEDGVSTQQAKLALEALLLERFEQDEDAYRLRTTDALEDTMSSITSVLTVLLGGIAAISLLVGGIGIMNIMLVTVTERTREIGIRKAIGASRGVILQQFLLESVMLCMLGCSIGIFASWAVLQAVGVVVSSLGMSFDMDLKVVLIAVGFCFAIGVGFGLYPANKAARMKPIDALHYGG